MVIGGIRDSVVHSVVPVAGPLKSVTAWVDCLNAAACRINRAHVTGRKGEHLEVVPLPRMLPIFLQYQYSEGKI